MIKIPKYLAYMLNFHTKKPTDTDTHTLKEHQTSMP